MLKVLLSTLASFAICGSAVACSCVNNEMRFAWLEKEGLRGEAFHGRLKRFISSDVAEFEVLESFGDGKAAVGSTRRLTAKRSSTSCDFMFSEESFPAVFFPQGEVLGACSTIGADPKTLARLRALSAGPLVPDVPGIRPVSERWPEIGLGFLGAALLASGAVFAQRRISRREDAGDK